MSNRQRAHTVRFARALLVASAIALVLAFVTAGDTSSLVTATLVTFAGLSGVACVAVGLALKERITAVGGALLALVNAGLVVVALAREGDRSEVPPPAVPHLPSPHEVYAGVPPPDALPKRPFDLEAPPPVGVAPSADVSADELIDRALDLAFEGGDPEAALPLATHAIARDDHRSIVFNAVVVLSLAGRVDAAVYYLQELALTQGVDAIFVEGDPDLEAVRASRYWSELRPFLRAAQVYWIHADVHRVPVNIPTALQGQPRIPALVWLHGAEGNPDLFVAKNAPRGEALGFATIGISATTPGGPNVFAWSGDARLDREHVLAALRGAAEAHATTFDPVVLIGLDEGAQLATELALSEQWVRGAIVMSPRLSGEAKDLDWLIEKRPGPRNAIVVVGEGARPEWLETAQAAAAVLERAGYDVEHHVTRNQHAHGLPPDFDERLAAWWYQTSGLSPR